MTSVAERVIDIARGEVGYHEGRSASGHWNNIQKYATQVPGLEWAQGQPWCAVFVSWVALAAGVPDLYPRTASCDVAMAWFRSRRRFSEYPAIGAQVFYGTLADSNHTGLVVDFDDTYITTVEGNTNTSGSREGDGVYLKKRVRRDAYVVGYGYPDFPEGIVSADPKWASEKPQTTEQKKRTPQPVPAPAPAKKPALIQPAYLRRALASAKAIARARGHKRVVQLITEFQKQARR